MCLKLVLYNGGDMRRAGFSESTPVRQDGMMERESDDGEPLNSGMTYTAYYQFFIIHFTISSKY